MQTLIRLLLKEQSDQGLHYLPMSFCQIDTSVFEILGHFTVVKKTNNTVLNLI